MSDLLHRLKEQSIRGAIPIILVLFFFLPGIVHADTATQTADTSIVAAEGNGGSLYKNPCSGDLVPGQEGCRDVNVLLLQLIRIAQFLISIIGTLAFLVFVYAGFSFVLSMGDGEKAKAALGMAFQAVLGIIITLSAYVIVGFLLDALGVTSGFRIL